MYQKTLSYYITMLYRSFAGFTGDKLQEVGLNFGLLFFIVYIGKRPNCTPSELTKELSLDWGHSQRCINRLVDDGLITKEKNGRHYMLNLTERGQQAFTIAHQAFFDWDAAFMTGLTPKEKAQLLALLEKQQKGFLIMYETINSPINYGGLELKNRIIFAPTTFGLSDDAYFEKSAKSLPADAR